VLTSTVGDWDANFVLSPHVIKTGATYELWYQANGQSAMHSTDGLTLTKFGGNPVLKEWLRRRPTAGFHRSATAASIECGSAMPSAGGGPSATPSRPMALPEPVAATRCHRARPVSP
jgi:hypothetical protein